MSPVAMGAVISVLVDKIHTIEERVVCHISPHDLWLMRGAIAPDARPVKEKTALPAVSIQPGREIDLPATIRAAGFGSAAFLSRRRKRGRSGLDHWATDRYPTTRPPSVRIVAVARCVTV